jgi:hypothetical protein
MPFDTRAIKDITGDAANAINELINPQQANSNTPNIIIDNNTNIQARRTRQLIRWRVPMFGFVDMYINPQSLKIDEKKMISKQRTKGGYVIQYWGEELATILISGHTGSSGIEGINILRKVYRAEQESFKSVSQVLVDRLNVFSGANTLQDVVGQSVANSVGRVASGALKTIVGGSPNPPLLPTLASLATAVEMFYQGWVFRGYFENFSVSESVGEGVGLFSYSMNFVVLDRRGFRSNFMPFHRSPANFDYNGNPIKNSYRKSDSASTPLNFSGEEIK